MKKKIQKFEDLEVWYEGMNLTEKVYLALANCRDFGLRDQLQRSCVSIPSNIAEGFDRQTNKEFIQFLHIAKGSCAEARTQLYLSIRLGLINKEKGEELLEQTRKISAMLFNFIEVRKTKF